MSDQQKEIVSVLPKTTEKNEIEEKNVLVKRGREAITRAEGSMSVMMEYRRRHTLLKPLYGARIVGRSYLDANTAVLIETLIALGAEVQWIGCNQEELRTIGSALKLTGVFFNDWFVPGYTYHPNILFDSNAELERMTRAFSLQCIKGIVETVEGFRDEKENDTQSSPVINIRELLEKPNAICCNYYRFEQSLVKHIKEFIDKIPAPDNVCVIVGYFRWSKSCARALRSAGITVMITEHNPVHSLEAEKDGFERVALEQAYKLATVLVAGADNPRIDLKHVNEMNAGSLVCTISCCSFVDYWSWHERYNKSELDRSYDGYLKTLVLNNEKHVQILEFNKKCSKRNSPLAVSYSCTIKLLALIEVWKNKDKTEGHKYWKDRSGILRKLEAKAARMHLSEFASVQRGNSVKSLWNDPIIYEHEKTSFSASNYWKTNRFVSFTTCEREQIINRNCVPKCEVSIIVDERKLK